MPKEKLVKINFRDYSGVRIACQYCDYLSRSETAIKLHRKMKHGITGKFQTDTFPTLMCNGCHKPKTNCICSKR